jgi:hypothetical protein
MSLLLFSLLVGVDWYFGFRSMHARVVNMVNWVIFCRSKIQIRNIARMSLLLGIFLFIKVVIEDSVTGKQNPNQEYR